MILKEEEEEGEEEKEKEEEEEEEKEGEEEEETLRDSLSNKHKRMLANDAIMTRTVLGLHRIPPKLYQCS